MLSEPTAFEATCAYCGVAFTLTIGQRKTLKRRPTSMVFCCKQHSYAGRPKASVRMDLVGQQFGRLTVIEEATRQGRYKRQLLCQCDCGNTSVVSYSDLTQGGTQSCGCLGNESRSNTHRTHGLSKSPEWYIWVGMRGRCNNPNNEAFENYGGRGITVCERWNNSFSDFLEDMGNRPSPIHSIDRINNAEGYCKANCRWTTPDVQARNRRPRIDSHYISFAGKTQTLAQWSRETGLSSPLIAQRLKRGLSAKDALTKPTRRSALSLEDARP